MGWTKGMTQYLRKIGSDGELACGTDGFRATSVIERLWRGGYVHAEWKRADERPRWTASLTPLGKKTYASMFKGPSP
jgi:hypothetical protein